MTAREDLLRAAQSLTDKGATPFSPVALIAEARVLGSQYPDITLRTIITSHMPGHELERVGRGAYVISGAPRPAPAGPERAPARAPAPLVEAHDEWFWEGNVQALVVRSLAGDGWHIMRVADTTSKEQGVDIEAGKAGQRMLVEVKGYPSTVYARGEKAGQAKTYNAATQARTYFSQALLSGLLMRADHPTHVVVLAFPDIGTFRTLGTRVAAELGKLHIAIWLVDEHGAVTAA